MASPKYPGPAISTSFSFSSFFLLLPFLLLAGALPTISSRPLLSGPTTMVTHNSEPVLKNKPSDKHPVRHSLERTSNHNRMRRELGYYSAASCETGNPIDDCWRCDPDWRSNRQKLADCAIGFGRNAIGGKNGDYYVVTDSSDDDPVNPKPGTLRHAVIQTEPLWIIFAADMAIQLKEELIMNSYKTIDGRGHNVHIANGPCITVQYVSNIIIHGLHIHDCKPAGNAMVRSSPTHYGWRTISDGDGVSLFGAKDVWVDHCSLASCTDGLIDAIMGSTDITISNNHFTQHDKVMLLGHSDSYVADKSMQVTIAFNHFGKGLVQRMPRCRHGFFEIVNNDYTQWEMYAIGGSAAPTINSRGNRYTASLNPFAKDVTMRINTPMGEWEGWDWRSEGDMFLNGAYFTASGAEASANYDKAASVGPKPSALVGVMTADAGALSCSSGDCYPSQTSPSSGGFGPPPFALGSPPSPYLPESPPSGGFGSPPFLPRSPPSPYLPGSPTSPSTHSRSSSSSLSLSKLLRLNTILLIFLLSQPLNV